MNQPPRTTASPAELDDEAVIWVERLISTAEPPIVMFGTGWCGFCWAARDVLQQLGVPYLDVDVGSAQALGGNDPREVRRVLRDLTGSQTVPQIFICGESIGGATDLIKALRSGHLAALLEPLGYAVKHAH